MTGAAVGTVVGATVGRMTGVAVGTVVGATVGTTTGTEVGAGVGSSSLKEISARPSSVKVTGVPFLVTAASSALSTSRAMESSMLMVAVEPEIATSVVSPLLFIIETVFVMLFSSDSKERTNASLETAGRETASCASSSEVSSSTKWSADAR